MQQRSETSFLSGTNAPFITELYARYAEDPNSVDPDWRAYFASLGDGAAEAMEDLRGASWAPRKPAFINGNGRAEPAIHAGNGAAAPLMTAAGPQGEAGPGTNIEALRAAARDSVRALTMVRAYRVRGHMEADLDPLGLKPIKPHADLDPATYGFTEADMDRPIYVNGAFGLDTAPLRELVARVRATYCGKIGVEFMHIQDPAQRAWIQDRIESVLNTTEFTDRGKRAILERLTAAEVFERFLDRKYTGTKRFGLDGGETLIPAMEQVVKRGSQLGISEVVLGMTHRGRLNVLANFMGKPFAAIFSEFQGNPANPEDVQGSADVKYHLGTSADREFDGKVVHLSLTANPSHLEAADTVVLGKVRAKQQQKKDTERQHSMALMLHGDASFAGQGLVAETLDLSDLKGYRTGGTVHFIINNQIGFTTNPVQSRSGPYCSEVGKMVQAPILHVNGDDPEAVVHVARIATEFRQQFKKDIIVDMFCYRRFGHNEGDEPGFTQPLMYKTIARHPTTRAIYAERLVKENIIAAGEAEQMAADFQQKLEREFDSAASYKPNKADWLEGAWSGLATASGEDRRGDTAVAREVLQRVGGSIARIPADFNANRKIVRFMEGRRQMAETGENIDWAMGEALAFGTLLDEGTPVRISGQDVGRGTFSQRHAVLIDQESEKPYIPLNNIRPG